MIDLIYKYPKLFIFASIACMLLMAFPYLDVTIMEARNFITAREMINDGNWLLTTMNGEARYEKPPLPTWLSAISASIFGINTFAMRLPGLLMAIVLSNTFFNLLRDLKLPLKHVVQGTFILITSFYVFAIIFEGPWDIYTHTFALLSALYFFKYFNSDNQKWFLAILGGVFLGLSILCKGPIGFYALWLPFMIAFGIVYRFKFYRGSSILLIASILIALVLGGWWYAYVRLADPETFIAITSRETSNWSSYNVRPFYYYWSFFTQSGLWTLPAFIALLYPYLKSRVTDKKTYKFAFLWTIITVILLSIIPEKKSRYLMPVLIPLAYNTSFYIQFITEHFHKLKNLAERIPVYVHFILIGLIGNAFGFIGWYLFNDLIILNFHLFIVLSILLFALAIAIHNSVKKKSMNKAFFFSIGFYIVLFSFISPFMSLNKGNAYRPITELKSDLGAQNLNLYSFNYVAPEMIWQYGKKIPSLNLKDNEIIFPQENEFALISNGISPEDQKKLLNRYYIEKGAVYNLNVADSTSNKYRGRLSNTLYYFTKK
ncbi:MAG: ArnT family glycosyltransferase [bacterium]